MIRTGEGHGRQSVVGATVRRIYDWWVDATTGGRYEARAKARALELLDARPGQRALNVGAGTGLDHRRLQAAVLLGFEG